MKRNLEVLEFSERTAIHAACAQLTSSVRSHAVIFQKAGAGAVSALFNSFSVKNGSMSIQLFLAFRFYVIVSLNVFIPSRSL